MYFIKVFTGMTVVTPLVINARKFVRLLNTKTFHDWQLSIIKQLGFTVSVVAYDPTKETNF